MVKPSREVVIPRAAAAIRARPPGVADGASFMIRATVLAVRVSRCMRARSATRFGQIRPTGSDADFRHVRLSEGILFRAAVPVRGDSVDVRHRVDLRVDIGLGYVVFADIVRICHRTGASVLAVRTAAVVAQAVERRLAVITLRPVGNEEVAPKGAFSLVVVRRIRIIAVPCAADHDLLVNARGVEVREDAARYPFFASDAARTRGGAVPFWGYADLAGECVRDPAAVFARDGLRARDRASDDVAHEHPAIRAVHHVAPVRDDRGLAVGINLIETIDRDEASHSHQTIHGR